MNHDRNIELFSRKRRLAARDRAYARAKGKDFLSQIMANETLDRLTLVKRNFRKCLVIGLPALTFRDRLVDQGLSVTIADTSATVSAAMRGVQCDDDRLPFSDHSFDLIINAGSLDTVNDLPGALILARRILRPDGLFLASFIGAESLPTIKAILMEAEGDRVAPHIHPQIDIRTMGDLMSRSGFQLPVVDGDTLRLRYSELKRIFNDIRDFGGTNVLSGDIKLISKSILARAEQIFAFRSEPDGKTLEKIELIHLSGWAPHPDQPKPAPRGSGQASLKDALKKI